MIDEDIQYMSRALEIATLGAGEVSTNPMVGAVVVYDGKIIGEGYHQRFGEAHAEVNALDSVADRDLIRHSTLYVNLEPCCHYGKTPPCCDLLIASKIKRVVVAMEDPFALVAGEGIRRMLDSGIDVEVGLMREEAEYLNRRFLTYHAKKRPYIIVKYARTQDGYIDNDREASTPASWLTGYPCRVLVHRWRSEEDAIMVGTNSVLRDNPSLTVREWYGRNPLRITIDKRNVIPPSSKIFSDNAQTLVFTHETIEDILYILYSRGIQSVLVEGGKTLVESFYQSGYIDEIREFISPLLLSDLKGGHGRGGVQAPEVQCTLISTQMIGNVVLNIKKPI
ncbi:MAG: bifunctional diaminohydroxyphosphoribosylaminopyrimidine deaminase/5-amino-6-(5-phosphoribosylamino)uracil reductase RibD [Rikenellaceae bacterium]